MRIHISIILAIFLADATLTQAARAETPRAPKGSIVAKHGRLRVQGNRIVDSSGKPVALPRP